MHELGIIVHISRTLEKLAVENELTKISVVTLEVGQASGIVPEFLIDCWQYYRKKSKVLQDSELKMETIPAVTLCESCDKTYPTLAYGKVCPYCQSEATYLITGNECNIKEIEAC